MNLAAIRNDIGRGHATSTNGWRVQFMTATNRFYALERTAWFDAWTEASPALPGSGGLMSLTDTNPPPGQAFYRVTRRRP